MNPNAAYLAYVASSYDPPVPPRWPNAPPDHPQFANQNYPPQPFPHPRAPPPPPNQQELSGRPFFGKDDVFLHFVRAPPVMRPPRDFDARRRQEEQQTFEEEQPYRLTKVQRPRRRRSPPRYRNLPPYGHRPGPPPERMLSNFELEEQLRQRSRRRVGPRRENDRPYAPKLDLSPPVETKQQEESDQEFDQQPGHRPTHYLAVPIINEQFAERVAAIQERIGSRYPLLKRGNIKTKSLHISLNILVLKNHSQVEIVRDLLNQFFQSARKMLSANHHRTASTGRNEITDKIEGILRELDFVSRWTNFDLGLSRDEERNGVFLDTKSVSHFDYSVVFVDMYETSVVEMLQFLFEVFQRIFQEFGIESLNDEFKPHVTIWKKTRLKKNGRECLRDLSRDYFAKEKIMDRKDRRIRLGLTKDMLDCCSLGKSLDGRVVLNSLLLCPLMLSNEPRRDEMRFAGLPVIEKLDLNQLC